jgi:uncharacterized NAD(P)/FAD-binding protein YdhS
MKLQFMEKIIIIGGGLSGILVTVNLLRNYPDKDLDITVIEKKPPGTIGHAYSTDKDAHILNVPAHKMSAFPDSSRDFIDWLAGAGYDFHEQAFVPRKIYGQYISHVLRETIRGKNGNHRCTFLNDTALDMFPSWKTISLESGRRISFDKVILAMGNYNPTRLKLEDDAYLSHPAYFASAWDNQLFNNLPAEGKVFIIGTGLTMVDTVTQLQHKRHQGRIVALSNHGFTPMSHVAPQSYPLTDLRPESIDTVLKALKIVNRHIKAAKRQGISWHAVVDAIRPFTQDIWCNLPAPEKIKFMEHLRHIWGVARHRMPPVCAESLHKLLSEGQLSIIAGRIRSIRTDGEDRFRVEYRERSSHKTVNVTVDTIVNCMGPESDYEKLDDPLIRSLLEKGMIRTDKLHLGIDCTREGIVIGRDGIESPFLYTIGPPTKGILWEITAVPEIRVAARRLAELIACKNPALV